jgi:hypothetical protein
MASTPKSSIYFLSTSSGETVGHQRPLLRAVARSLAIGLGSVGADETGFIVIALTRFKIELNVWTFGPGRAKVDAVDVTGAVNITHRASATSITWTGRILVFPPFSLNRIGYPASQQWATRHKTTIKRILDELTSHGVKQPIFRTVQSRWPDDSSFRESITNSSFSSIFRSVECRCRIGRSVQVRNVDESRDSNVCADFCDSLCGPVCQFLVYVNISWRLT